MKHPLLSIFITAALAQCPAQSEAAQRLFKCVDTTSGSVAGRASTKNPAVFEYLGIPYGQAPIADLRFAPPQAFNGSGGSINGTQWGNTCPKLLTDAQSLIPANFPNVSDVYTASGISVLNTFAQVGNFNENEDCLNLNVWTKPQTGPQQVGDKQKAVLVWLSGEAFKDSATDLPIYDGSTIVDEEDVIFVSVNYRANIFGFSGDATGPTSNYGMLDQRLAIEWVSNNIANFGGDINRISLVGQSAGSELVDYYSYAYPQDTIITGMIMQSGTRESHLTQSKASASVAWQAVAQYLGCGDSSADPNTVIACMRKPDLTTAQILDVARLQNWYPSIDDTLVFSDYPARAAAGNVSRVPLLIGNTDNESGILAAQAPMANGNGLVDWSFLSNTTVACPTSARANLAATVGAPTWRYRYFGDFPNLQIRTDIDAGAFHSSDVYSILGSWPAGDGIPDATAEEIALGKYMRGAWATFAKDTQKGLSTYQGENCEGLAENDLPLNCGWPIYSAQKEVVIRLGWENKVDIVVDEAELWDSTCGELEVNDGIASTIMKVGGLKRRSVNWV